MLLATRFDLLVYSPTNFCHRDCWTAQADWTGTYQVRMEFKYDGGGLAKGRNVSLYLDREEDGEGRVAMTARMIFP